MYQAFSNLIDTISGYMYSYILIILLLAVGLYFTLRSGLVQLRLLPESIRVVSEKPKGQNSISAFQALMVSTASRVGTGNIVGVASAIAAGGYGAVFWMWLIALVGGASAFVESTLAQIYKKRDPEGGSYGGPSYYIQAAGWAFSLPWPWWLPMPAGLTCSVPSISSAALPATPSIPPRARWPSEVRSSAWWQWSEAGCWLCWWRCASLAAGGALSG